MTEQEQQVDVVLDPRAAFVSGESLKSWPKDLYIPPYALEVILEQFSGPLDLLLYLIRKQNIDILDIPVADITRQYMAYIEFMQKIRIDLASEYLVMAATLAEIKSRMLLPKKVDEDEDEDDPRGVLIRRLQEYERFRSAAIHLDTRPRLERDLHLAYAKMNTPTPKKVEAKVDLSELIEAMRRAIVSAEKRRSFQITREVLSVRERMIQILDQVKTGQFSRIESFFSLDEGRMGLVVSFVAILELARDGLVNITQNESLAPIYVKLARE
ncbi:MAG: segregation/condensation protein A [Acidiferrobacteraceae bacterium]|nr:segregation/condensation protein A [Acidiferrobacteraceae bacterium]